MKVIHLLHLFSLYQNSKENDEAVQLLKDMANICLKGFISVSGTAEGNHDKAHFPM